MKDRYGQSNAPRLYQVQKTLASISQGNLCVSEYFTQLKTTWDEYLSLISLPTCSCGTGTAFATLLQTQQVMQSLMGLNDDYKTARGSILMMQTLPSINQVYRPILQEDKESVKLQLAWILILLH